MTQTLVSRQRQLCAVLRQTRSEAALTHHQVAERMNWPLSKVVAIETGTAGISSAEMTTLLKLYGVADNTRVNELTRLIEANKTDEWWRSAEPGVAEFVTRHSPTLRRFLELEKSTSCRRSYTPAIIPGLLQTREYTQALFERFDHTFPSKYSTEELAVGADIRMRRQESLTSERDEPEIQCQCTDLAS